MCKDVKQQEPERQHDHPSTGDNEFVKQNVSGLSISGSAQRPPSGRLHACADLYTRDGSAIDSSNPIPLEAAIYRRHAVSTFRSNEMVFLKSTTEADLILCLSLEAELEVAPADVAAVVEVLLKDGVVAIYAATAFAPSAVFETHIRPALVKLVSDQLRKTHRLEARADYIRVVK